MFLLDSLIIGGLRFVLDKIVVATETEVQDDDVLRERLLEAQMRVELGELTEAEFAEIERDVVAALRELRGQRVGLSMSSSEGVRVTGVEATVADELDSPGR
jgi:Gas vesicle protein G